MAKTDIARRVYNHTWKLDPIVRSLLDTDFYKLLMLQMIWGLYPKVDATFSLINRTTSVRLAEEIDEAGTARPARPCPHAALLQEGDDLAGRQQLLWPQADLRAGVPRLARGFPAAGIRAARSATASTSSNFTGPWMDTTMWEIPALAIINELRSRAAMKAFGPFALDVLYARAKAKMWAKVERLKRYRTSASPISAPAAATRFLWQRWCVEALKEGIGEAFTGTRNVLLAMDTDLEALGTNAHELPMVLAALADTEEELRAVALQGAAGLAALLWRQSADRAARRLRHRRVPARRAGLGRRLDRLPARQRAADRGRREDHRLVAREGQGPAEEAADLLRRARRRDDRGDLPAFPRQGAHGLRLGHQPHQRFRGLRADRDQPGSTRSRWSARSPRPMAARRSSSPTIRPRRPATRRRSRATCAYSARPTACEQLVKV